MSHCLQSTALTGSHCARIHWGLSLVLLRFVAAGCRCLQQVCVPGASPMVDSTSFRGRVRRLLTDGFLRAEKPPKEGRTEIIDLRCPGLVFRITANGARTWAFRFRDQQSGRQGRAKIGAYPATTLEAARIAATGMRQIVDSGGNATQERRAARSGAGSYGAWAQRYLVEHSRRRKRTHAADERNLRKHILPKWAHRPVAAIGAREAVCAALQCLIRHPSDTRWSTVLDSILHGTSASVVPLSVARGGGRHGA
jgi:hypothetical protein